ncbi:DUF3857 domain-containing protein [Psychroserpens sp. XS_ASV72]|uniref:DUF3857 domain-containing protein n=1 Tax=Psychroserpens sp. XS_ASV72 TaxID=3241293 RepID=UPI003518BA11
MIRTSWLLFLLLLIPTFDYSQEKELLQSFLISLELTENANAVVRMENTNIEILSIDRMVMTKKRIVTILNSSANNKHRAYANYDESTKIKKLEATIYDKFGEEIKKIKERDFIDQSAVSGGTLYSDSRVKYLDYTPISYPYTVVFEVEVEYRSTAFIHSWTPIEGFYTSTQSASYRIQNNTGIELKVKATNLEHYNIEKIDDTNYKAKNLKALRYESYSPSFDVFAPKLEVALLEFSYEGYNGHTRDWESMGKWMYDELLQDRDLVSESTKAIILGLVEGIEDPIEKAEIVYNYVQENTRYVSVQEGIGGIQPIEASMVDKVKYGDCKGLSNYTKALLDIVGVESYYTRVYGSDELVNVNEDFVTFIGQTNHVILYLPYEGTDYWLECTSQTTPFGFTANFTDDRDVFVISPEGGKIVHTKAYKTDENLLDTKAEIVFDENGSFEAKVVSKSYGTQYGRHSEKELLTSKDCELSFKNYWSYINALNIQEIDFENDKDSIVFTESLKLSATRYAAKAGNRLLLQPNAFNRIESAPKRYSKRTLPFEIERGFSDTDSYTIEIPENFTVEALMDAISIENKFGTYKASVTKIADNKLEYKREFVIHKGQYAKEEYKDFREFWLNVVKHDKSKIVVKPKT